MKSLLHILFHSTASPPLAGLHCTTATYYYLHYVYHGLLTTTSTNTSSMYMVGILDAAKALINSSFKIHVLLQK